MTAGSFSSYFLRKSGRIKAATNVEEGESVCGLKKETNRKETSTCNRTNDADERQRRRGRGSDLAYLLKDAKHS